ncbi:MAG: radical SAM protein [Halioglobus sp.]
MSKHNASQMAATEERMAHLFTPNQVLGRLQTIGCVAVEITQRCNLDCTLCYLSEHSQQVRDIPISEVFKRLDSVVTHFGRGTHVQITGGDPTLRKHRELFEIVRYASDIGLHTAMFTNGIAASRQLLSKLADAGLKDVAFHVDSTQRREQFETEEDLNQVRQEYIERARGLGLMVIFNTTVHRENFACVPKLVEFFTANADVVGLASFQLQAETGRGEWRSRDAVISQKTVQEKLEQGVGKSLPWGVVQVGHTDCHSYMPTLVTSGEVYPLATNLNFFCDFLNDFQGKAWDRLSGFTHVAGSFLLNVLKNPRWWPRLIGYLGTQLANMGADIVRSGGRVHKLTFFVQNFMDAEHLEQDRIDGCSVMLMTDDGPMSMCKHNASRDEFILKPITVTDSDGSEVQYEPLKWAKPNGSAINSSQIENLAG